MFALYVIKVKLKKTFLNICGVCIQLLKVREDHSSGPQSSGVNFTNILRPNFTPADPKSAKKTDN